MRYALACFGGAAVMNGLSLMWLGGDHGSTVGWAALAVALALYVGGGGLWWAAQWRKDYDERFDKHISRLYTGWDDAFRQRYSSLILAHKQGPFETWEGAATASSIWVLAEADAQLSPESDLLEFAYWMYQGPTMAMNVPNDVHEARRSIAHYLAEVAPKAKRWFLFRWWLRERIRKHYPLAKMLLCSEIALSRRLGTSPGGAWPQYVPALFKPSGPHT